MSDDVQQLVMQATTPVALCHRLTVSLDDNARTQLQALYERVRAFEQALDEARREAYLRGTPVFAISPTRLATDWRDRGQPIPPRTVELIADRNAYRWLTVYMAVLYHDSGWHQALTGYRDKYRYAGTTLLLGPQILSYSTDRTVGLAVGDLSIFASLNEATTAALRSAKTVRLCREPFDQSTAERARQTPETPAYYFQAETPQRAYAPTPGPDDTLSEEHSRQLDRCTAPMSDPSSMRVVGEVLATGYVTSRTCLHWIALLTGKRTVVSIPYRPSTAFITERLIALFDLAVEPVPQSGRLLLSQEPTRLPSLALAQSFPDRQTLSVEEQRTLREALGYPGNAIEASCSRSYAEHRATERLALCYGAGGLPRAEIDAYQFASYEPAPTEAGLYQRVRDGRMIQQALTDFDATHDTALSEYVTAGTTFEHLYIA